MDKIASDDFSSQLRSLRLLLGKNFRPVSTKTLASLTGIALVSIRAVEAGRRRLNEDDRWTIALLLGADWDPKSGQWIAFRDQMPYTREKYELHKSLLLRGPDLEGLRADYHKMIDEYLDGLGPAKLHFGLSRLYSALRQILKPEGSSPAVQTEKGTSLLNRLEPRLFDRSLNRRSFRGCSSRKRNHLPARRGREEIPEISCGLG